jgi:hypothetical protein
MKPKQSFEATINLKENTRPSFILVFMSGIGVCSRKIYKFNLNNVNNINSKTQHIRNKTISKNKKNEYILKGDFQHSLPCTEIPKKYFRLIFILYSQMDDIIHRCGECYYDKNDKPGGSIIQYFNDNEYINLGDITLNVDFKFSEEKYEYPYVNLYDKPNGNARQMIYDRIFVPYVRYINNIKLPVLSYCLWFQKSLKISKSVLNGWIDEILEYNPNLCDHILLGRLCIFYLRRSFTYHRDQTYDKNHGIVDIDQYDDIFFTNGGDCEDFARATYMIFRFFQESEFDKECDNKIYDLHMISKRYIPFLTLGTLSHRYKIDGHMWCVAIPKSIFYPRCSLSKIENIDYNNKLPILHLDSCTDGIKTTLHEKSDNFNSYDILNMTYDSAVSLYTDYFIDEEKRDTNPIAFTVVKNNIFGIPYSQFLNKDFTINIAKFVSKEKYISILNIMQYTSPGNIPYFEHEITVGR